MFAPVGSKPPVVYWRRRLVVLGSAALLIVLMVLTVRAVTSGGGSAAAASASTSSKPAPQSATRSAAAIAPTTSAPRPSSSGAPSKPSAKASASHGSKAVPTSAPPPAPCTAQALAVTAVVAKATYKVGEHPVVELQVTNIGAKPCVQDLADKQIELRIYNGESRVWGSHDCQIQPGSDDRTLAVKRPVRVSMTWSGLTSAKGCTGTRQRVGAGTYTLYALLSGRTGKAAQFAFN